MIPRVCDDVRAALGSAEFCEETERGARVITHCLYPSFEPVSVFVARFGDGYAVSDAGGAVAAAWIHGRDDIRKILKREAVRFGVEAAGDSIQAEAASLEWLRGAILAVANASSSSARYAVERAVLANEKVLAERIYEALARVVPAQRIAREFEYRGASGKNWRADYAVVTDSNRLIVNAVTPHHASISAKYVAFADIESDGNSVEKFAVFERPLESDDKSLITQVAALVPIKSLAAGTRRALAH